MYFLRTRTPLALRVFFNCLLNKGVSSGARYFESKAAINGRVMASTIAVSSLFWRRFRRTFFSMESKFNVRETPRSLEVVEVEEDTEVAEEVDAILTEDEER